MIRTPLARRIESDEVLNTVELFLPHYDSEALEGVLTKFRNLPRRDWAYGACRHVPPTRRIVLVHVGELGVDLGP